MKIVIRAGGSGTRLWPLSRQNHPKQFIPLLDSRSLLQRKFQEIKPLLRSISDLYISVAAPFANTVRRTLPQLPKANIIVEPCGRNTGPAVGLESVYIKTRLQPGENPVIASLTVDDVFKSVDRFRKTLRASERLLLQKPDLILTIASRVRQPDSGLSYIEIGERIRSNKSSSIFFFAKRWIEKPRDKQLKQIIGNPKYFAHTGLYIWRQSTILQNFKLFQPTIYHRLEKIGRAFGTARYQKVLKRQYAALPSASIEELIARRVKPIGVAAGDFGWSDTGKWHLIHQLLPQDQAGNVFRGKTLSLTAKNTLILANSGRLVVALGVKDLAIIDTSDALLVMPKDRSAEVKQIVDELKKRSLKRYL